MSWKSRSYTLYNKENEIAGKTGVYLKRRSTGILNPTFEPELTDFVIDATYGGRQQSQNSTRGYNVDDHKVSLETIFQRYESHPIEGLSAEGVRKNHAKFGPNVLFPPKKTSEIIKFVKNCLLGLNLLFWICGILSLVVYVVQYLTVEEEDRDDDNLYSGISLLVVVLVAGCFSYYQEFKSSKIMESFKTMMPANAIVWREGRRVEVDVNAIVVGDIVEIKYGDRVPADIRLIQCEGLKVDNSSLTGESEPQKRTVLYSDKNPMETSNLVFFSTSVVEGSGKGIVYRVGDGTFMGRNKFQVSIHDTKDISDPRYLLVMKGAPERVVDMSTAAVVTGPRLAEMEPHELDDLLINHEEIVFARTSPEQKYLIVKAFQRTGNVVAVTGFFAYFVVLGYHGWLPDRLLFIQTEWDSAAIQDLTDSYGQEWTYTARQKVGVAAQTAFFVALVAMQWVNAIACKTRRLSIFQKKMKNNAMNAALIGSPLIAFFFMHTPGLNDGVSLTPLCWQVYAAIVPFLLLTFVYDELRRWAVRVFRTGWVAQELYV
ncbi:unnamed protein product [Allacma fusca]|uniref:Na(+)/K(+)-exchanging ATPase n=1 Tax=Allacma fusca TaxID=39272 RepID=A0A8J2K8G8_9HEXA|nr:unnamed protein product [Allacma fusca]